MLVCCQRDFCMFIACTGGNSCKPAWAGVQPARHADAAAQQPWWRHMGLSCAGRSSRFVSWYRAAGESKLARQSAGLCGSTLEHGFAAAHMSMALPQYMSLALPQQHANTRRPAPWAADALSSTAGGEGTRLVSHSPHKPLFTARLVPCLRPCWHTGQCGVWCYQYHGHTAAPGGQQHHLFSRGATA